jgi:cytochrome c
MQFLKVITLSIFIFTSNLAFADAEKAKGLLKSKNCLACHAVDKKLVGPSYKDVAAKYKGDKTAPDMIAKKIIKGGSGNWGPIPMPPHSISDADALMLAKYILAM